MHALANGIVNSVNVGIALRKPFSVIDALAERDGNVVSRQYSDGDSGGNASCHSLPLEESEPDSNAALERFRDGNAATRDFCSADRLSYRSRGNWNCHTVRTLDAALESCCFDVVRSRPCTGSCSIISPTHPPTPRTVAVLSRVAP